jgi:molybdenum cofactor biosynthesis enzyme MoaA
LLETFLPVTMLSELTARCNLRCTYCPKGDLNKDSWNGAPGRDEDMDSTSLERYMGAISSLPFQQIQLSGVGEFSFRSDWVQVGVRVRELSDAKISIISNFGRVFNNDELDFLLTLFHITISVDTPDATLLKKVRKAVDIKVITLNIINLRARSIETGTSMPLIKINGTIYAENLTHIHSLSCFAASLRVDVLQLTRVSLSEANEFPHPISLAQSKDAAEAIRQLDLARQVCLESGIEYVEFGDLRSELVARSHENGI